MRTRPERSESEATDGGFTLVELSVAMTVLFAVLLPFMFTLLNLMAKETASFMVDILREPPPIKVIRNRLGSARSQFISKLKKPCHSWIHP